MAEAPERAHVLIAKFGADTANRLADELRFMADQIDRDRLSTGCIGSPSAGVIYSYRIRPEQTHDAYFEQIEEWLADKKTYPTPAPRAVGSEANHDLSQKHLIRRCVEIADQVVPSYRGKGLCCTGPTAKRWQAAYDGAARALGLDDEEQA